MSVSRATKVRQAKRAKDQAQYNVGHASRRALQFEIGHSPFEGLKEADAHELFVQIGKDHGKSFEESFDELRQMLHSVNPVMLLSILSFLSCFANSLRNPLRTLKYAVLQHHVELFQGLILMSQLEHFDLRQPIPPQMQRFIELVGETEQSFAIRRYADVDPALPLEERHSARLIEMVRSHTQSVRNWGYPQQIHAMVTELFAPLEEEIEARFGVRVEHLVQMFISITSSAEARVNAHLRLFRPAMQARTITTLVKRFQKSFPAAVPSCEETVAFFKTNKIGLQEARAIIFSFSDQLLPNRFIFSVDDFVAAYPRALDPQVLGSVLDRWSLSFGDLSTTEPEHLFMKNPVWTRPFIKLDDKYFIPVVGLTLSFCLEMIEGVVCEDANVKSRYERRRGKFLEEKTKQSFQRAFPSAEIFQGSLWTDSNSGKIYENDLVVLIDSFLIIVEAKSGRVPSPARRGARESLRTTIQTLLVDPSVQCKRFADHLERNPGIHWFSTRDGSENRIDTSGVKKIVRLSVTFDLLGPLQASLRDLVHAGMVSPEVDLNPAMHLADLEIVLETLERNSEKLHYLARRAEFESHAKYIADEADLLALYLDRGLNLGEHEFDGTLLVLYGLSRILDPYHMRKWTGRRVGRPKRRYSKWWTKMLDRLEMQPMHGWSEIAFMLLNVSYEQQLWFEREFRKCQRLVSSKTWKMGDDNAFFCLAGAPQQPTLILGFAYKGLSRADRNNLIENGAVTVMNTQSISKAVVIGIDVEKNSDPYPYNMLSMVGR
jgi:hypothetical protein